ncbi:MAG: diadenylate cyclase CdaA [Dissulfurispiraceae bacterium]|jgi:diadenylate cyclase|nr:diadenylate cyclase CdaA [Dissulfurispiraceae bacterium]
MLRQIRWQDVLDMAIVSIILYRVLLLIKGTKAAQILAGIGVLLLASFISKYFQFYTMDWLVQSFLSQLVLGMIILFQPELRKALAKVGESSLFRGVTTAEEMKSIEEIVRASAALANRKIGALIVIEKDMTLADYIEVGIPLDAKVSKELLISIFHPSSPIHDGAVILRGNRIVAAGCFLPIALGSDMSKALGTRHRAGVGITEETDAVVIIVSEENGTIAVGIDGKLKGPVDMSRLREMLAEMFTRKKEQRNSKKRSQGISDKTRK